MKAAKKPKLGRPRVPKKLAKDSLLSVRFSADERNSLGRAATREGLRLSDWARRTLLNAASSDRDSG